MYKSLGSHDPHSTQVISERKKLYDLDPAWHICSPTPDALHVCAAYPWAAYALVFADGSAHFTARGLQQRKRNPHLEYPSVDAFERNCVCGVPMSESGYLESQEGKYGSDFPRYYCCYTCGGCGPTYCHVCGACICCCDCDTTFHLTYREVDCGADVLLFRKL
jgi:hypothetical protein